VTNAIQDPVVNAMIMIDGQKTSSITDSQGKYRVRVPINAKTVGIISFGNGLIEEQINGRTEINFKYTKSSTMQPQIDQTIPQGDERVNKGYNYQSRKDNTSPGDHIDGKDKKYASYSSVSEMILREVSGVKLTSSGYVIQDSKDFFGAVPALLIVDGVPVDSFDGITPSSVESIDVLKGTSAAIYGTRGYGGVIIIKTKVKNN
jgi:TonB-dependent SusC/RagA subfamily outer membrane receptor